MVKFVKTNDLHTVLSPDEIRWLFKDGNYPSGWVNVRTMTGRIIMWNPDASVWHVSIG